MIKGAFVFIGVMATFVSAIVFYGEKNSKSLSNDQLVGMLEECRTQLDKIVDKCVVLKQHNFNNHYNESEGVCHE